MESTPRSELRPARFSDRFVAYLLDTAPFAGGAVLAIWVWGAILQRPVTDAAMAGDALAWLGLALLWQFAGNLAGGTPGKRVMGLAVVTEGGGRPGVARALARALGWLLSTPLGNFGFWLALFNKRTRTLHDFLSGTYVVEAGPRRSGGATAFLIAAPAAVGLFALQYWASLLRPTRADVAAVVKAQEGLAVVAKLQEAYKAKNGTYANSISELASASGDEALFRSAMLDVFAPTPFNVEGGNRRWRVTAAAKDRRHTLVRREGP